ncbi:MAG: phosphomethylpyrimidine synthase ThiC [Syntrophomonadaceae bacterium]|nr:phosphomethylpyrimidine synthase ThiC [Syntrophomonadaceae bacterium]
MNYKTQKEAARKGIITPQIQAVAEKESIEIKQLMQLIAGGQVAVPANKNHHSLDAQGIGQGLSTKINVNLGTSGDCCNIDKELEKVQTALDMKAEAIMDLSTAGNTQLFRRRLIEMSAAMIGTVPVYDALCYYDDKKLGDISAAEFLKVVEMHARDGVDFMTVHSGINRKTAERFRNNPRLTNIVSRGGSLIYAWMQMTQNENPFYEYFDELVDICREYDVTLSLGDACRPGSIADSTDACQIEELITLGELTKRAWKKDVQVIIEGPGHMAINEIAANMRLEKKLCYGAPFYVLGPVVTDIAPGYDHITAAIGGAIAAANGADFLCYVTPAEHLRLPTYEDMKEGIIATKIAAHAADIAKGVSGAREWDNKMSEARRMMDWDKMFTLAIDPEKAKRYRAESMPQDQKSCTMCGKMCAVKTMNQVLADNETML